MSEVMEATREALSWRVSGQGYFFFVHLPETVLAESGAMPAGLGASRRGRVAWAALVDYADSPVGRYQEMIFVPGSFAFGDGRHPSITRSYVSNREAVARGRDTWGIPREYCDFRVNHGADRLDHIHLRAEDGTVFADIQTEHKYLRLPLAGSWIPAAMRTLAQQRDGREFTFTLAPSGHVKWASVLNWRFDPRYFPDLAQGRLLAAIKVTDFEMIFPEALVRSL